MINPYDPSQRQAYRLYTTKYEDGTFSPREHMFSLTLPRLNDQMLFKAFPQKTDESSHLMLAGSTLYEMQFTTDFDWSSFSQQLLYLKFLNSKNFNHYVRKVGEFDDKILETILPNAVDLQLLGQRKDLVFVLTYNSIQLRGLLFKKAGSSLSLLYSKSFEDFADLNEWVFEVSD